MIFCTVFLHPHQELFRQCHRLDRERAAFLCSGRSGAELSAERMLWMCQRCSMRKLNVCQGGMSASNQPCVRHSMTAWMKIMRPLNQGKLHTWLTTEATRMPSTGGLRPCGGSHTRCRTSGNDTCKPRCWWLRVTGLDPFSLSEQKIHVQSTCKGSVFRSQCCAVGALPPSATDFSGLPPLHPTSMGAWKNVETSNLGWFVPVALLLTPCRQDFFSFIVSWMPTVDVVLEGDRGEIVQGTKNVCDMLQTQTQWSPTYADYLPPPRRDRDWASPCDNREQRLTAWRQAPPTMGLRTSLIQNGPRSD